MKFKIREYIYEIMFVDEFDDLLIDPLNKDIYHFGICSWKKQKIYIADSLNKLMTRRVIIHEITHAVLEAYGFHAHRNDFDDEDICEFMSVYAVEIVSLCDNFLKGKKVYGEENKHGRAFI